MPSSQNQKGRTRRPSTSASGRDAAREAVADALVTAGVCLIETERRIQLAARLADLGITADDVLILYEHFVRQRGPDKAAGLVYNALRSASPTDAVASVREHLRRRESARTDGMPSHYNASETPRWRRCEHGVIEWKACDECGREADGRRETESSDAE